jgi:hypothetical protein
MYAVSKTCHSLQKLNVGRCHAISNHSIIQLSLNCNQLKDCNIAWSLCEDSGMNCILLHCPLLTHLCIQGCKSITSNGISNHVIHHTSLQWIDASWCNAISEKIAKKLVEERKKNNALIDLEILDYYGESTKNG